jgi:signal transduction histidine kinase
VAGESGFRRILTDVIVLLLLLACVALAASTASFGLFAIRSRRERREAADLIGAPYRDLAAGIARLLGDTTPRAAAEELAATLDAVLAAVPAPVIVLAADRTVLRATEPAHAIFPGAVAGAVLDELPVAVRQRIDQALADGHPVDAEVHLDAPARRTFELHVRPFGGGGAGGGAVVSFIDVTGAVDFREARRLFSAAVSHELRTPLARILGLAETLGLPGSQADRDALVTMTAVEIDNMRRLIDEMLLLAALDRGETASTVETCDAGGIAEAVIADRRARRTARDRGLSVTADRGKRVPVPARLLEVVLGNIVDNALRHAGPDARVDVTVRDLGTEVEIVVADNGVGIAPEHLPHVFERFYRAEASRAGPGTGLGLAVVKHIAEAHGGRVAAESVPGVGTTIRLVLPEATTAPDRQPADVGSNR